MSTTLHSTSMFFEGEIPASWTDFAKQALAKAAGMGDDFKSCAGHDWARKQEGDWVLHVCRGPSHQSHLIQAWASRGRNHDFQPVHLGTYDPNP